MRSQQEEAEKRNRLVAKDREGGLKSGGEGVTCVELWFGSAGISSTHKQQKAGNLQEMAKSRERRGRRERQEGGKEAGRVGGRESGKEIPPLAVASPDPGWSSYQHQRRTFYLSTLFSDYLKN